MPALGRTKRVHELPVANNVRGDGSSENDTSEHDSSDNDVDDDDEHGELRRAAVKRQLFADVKEKGWVKRGRPKQTAETGKDQRAKNKKRPVSNDKGKKLAESVDLAGGDE